MTNATWRTKIDNYESRRQEWAAGELQFILNAQGTPTVVLNGVGQLKDWEKSLFVIDDGATARIMFITGWNPRTLDTAWLADFPVNPDGNTRPDNGRTASYDRWALGPRRTYHLKVKAVD